MQGESNFQAEKALLLKCRSLDQIYRRSGFVPIDIVGAVAEAVLKGLVYLYDVHRIIHRGELKKVDQSPS
jgi:hypothetical protein